MNMPIGGWQPSRLPVIPGDGFGGQDSLPLSGKQPGVPGETNNILSYGSSLPQSPVMMDGNSKVPVNNALSLGDQSNVPGTDGAQAPQMNELMQAMQMMLALIFQFLSSMQNNNSNNNSSGNDNAGNQGNNQNQQPGSQMSPMQMLNALLSQFFNNDKPEDDAAGDNSAGGNGEQSAMQTPQQQPQNTPQQPPLNGQQPQNTPQQPPLNGQQPQNTPQQPPLNSQQPQNTPQQPDTPVTPPVNGAKSTTPPLSVDDYPDVDPNINSVTFENKGTEPMTVKFTPNAENANSNIPDMTIQPGETKTRQLDNDWGGNFRTTNGDGNNVTLGEVKFDEKSNTTFYDVSYIEGYNARMRMQPMGGGRVSGTLDDLAKDAPDSIKARDADGNAYGLKKTTHAEQIDNNIVNYYRTKVDTAEGYVVPKDDASTLGANSRNLKVELM